MVHVAANGLDKSWLGRRIDEVAAVELAKLSEKYGINVCGEGGEYESLVVDAPWFKEKLVIDDAEVVWEGTSGTYAVKGAHLAPKAHKG